MLTDDRSVNHGGLAIQQSLRLVGNQTGGSDLIVPVEIHQSHPLGASAHGSNGTGFQTDQFPLGGDEDDSGILVYLQDGQHFPVSIRRLHIDDALAASGLIAIGANRGALPVTVLGDRQDQALVPPHRHTYKIVASH